MVNDFDELGDIKTKKLDIVHHEVDFLLGRLLELVYGDLSLTILDDQDEAVFFYAIGLQLNFNIFGSQVFFK